ncbi:MAG: sulfatase-like hydrolase/transferase, partial [Planctomycetaceae bacterium]|nr:sulfatase-like hydrolase/transferase [Planctomycetaceae bacterium]
MRLATRVCLFLAVVLIASTLRAQPGQRQGKPKVDPRPNVLFLLTDDQAPWALGLSGHPHALTPHMDALFRSGAYLPNCFTPTPVCSPARTSIITGRYGSELGITDWIRPGAEDELGLATGTPVWPQFLQDAGYQTALIGKWHLGTRPHQHPTKFGYDYFLGMTEGGTRPVNPRLEVNGEFQIVNGFPPDIFTDEAVRWLRLIDLAKPFCLCVHYREPHAAFVPVRDEDWEPFATLDPQIPNPDYPKLDVPRVKKMTREYLACVHGVDRSVGNILGELERIGAGENTIVIYSSDHGYNMGHNGIWHKGNGHWVLTEPPPATENVPKGQRPNMYDHSLRVPTAIRWPGVVEPGTIVKETVSHLDWFPTILDMAGVTVPNDVPLRGRSIVPVLKGQGRDWDND